MKRPRFIYIDLCSISGKIISSDLANPFFDKDEQREQKDEIAPSLDPVNVVPANRNSQLGNQLAQAEQERSRLQQDEAQLRQQLAEQRRRNDEIAKSLDHLNEQRRLLDEETLSTKASGCGAASLV